MFFNLTIFLAINSSSLSFVVSVIVDLDSDFLIFAIDLIFHYNQ